MELPDIIIRNPLHPYRLPDTGNRGIPHTAPVPALLAVGHGFVPQIVPGLHQQFIFRLQKFRHVERKAIIAAGVLPQQLPVEPDPGMLVHRPEVQQYPSRSPRGSKPAAIVQASSIRDFLMNPGKQRLRRERHQDGPVEVPTLPYRKVP